MSNPLCAVMFRCHFRSPQIDSALKRLQRSAVENVIVLKDCSLNKDTFDSPCVYFSEQEVYSLGLATFNSEKWAWCMGDYALYVAMTRNPSCQYFVMIDYDVYINFDVQDFINKCIEGKYSYVAGYAGFKNDTWMWSRYSKLWFSDFRGSFFPIVFVSRHLLEECLLFRRSVSARYVSDCKSGVRASDTFEYMLNCEAVLPSVAAKSGHRLGDLQDVVPDFDYKYFRDVDFIPLEYFPFQKYKASHPALPFESLSEKLRNAVTSNSPHGRNMAERFLHLVDDEVLPINAAQVSELLDFIDAKLGMSPDRSRRNIREGRQ